MGDRTFVQAHALFYWAKKSLHTAKVKMKERFYAQGVNTIQYREGDLVWLSVTNLRIRHPNTKYLQIHPTVSISQVKSYYRKDGVAPPVVIYDNIEWEVTAILNHNIVQN